MINASGENSEFVLIVAIKDFPENEWHVEKVMGLSISTSIGTSGTIYFSKTRCGTVDMWHDYFIRIVIPSIKLSNDFHTNCLDCEASSCKTKAELS
jgi:hypothetical protein